jgi:hypothetical protein
MMFDVGEELDNGHSLANPAASPRGNLISVSMNLARSMNAAGAHGA